MKTNADAAYEKRKQRERDKALEGLTAEAAALRAHGWMHLAREVDQKIARIKRRIERKAAE